MKKKIFLILAILLCLGAVLALIACGTDTPATPDHTHTYGEWVETTAPTCTTRGIKTRVCDCGHSETQYVDLKDHIYSEWVETLAATCVAEGSHYKTCKTCSYKVTETIPIDASKHIPASTWTTDGTNHWKVCTRTGCTVQLNKGAHTSAWSSNTANHWKDCTACGYDVDPIAAHTYDAENTCVCGDYKDKGVQFTLSNGTYEVSGYTGTATEVVIPSTYKGVAVTSIGNSAFFDCSQLTTITIPAGVTSIGDYAFENCSQLTTVEFGANSKLTSIGVKAFSSCDSLTTVNFGDNSQLQSIGSNAFYNCSSLTTITIPDSVTSIGAFAFYQCSNLTTITIPASVTSIGESAFYSCESLTTVSFGTNSQLTSIGDKAFYWCSNLTSITIPANVRSIGDDAFAACINLTSAIFANTSGWWYADSADATSGTAISAADLENTGTAATYLTDTYSGNYWKRS